MQVRAAVLSFAAAAAALAFISPLEEAELRTLDLQFQAIRSAGVPPGDRVVVVGIDDRSVAAIDEPVGLWHGHFARFLQALAPAKPAVVAFDVVMPDRSFARLREGMEVELLRALISTRQVFPTILGVTIHNDGKPRQVHPTFITAAGTRPGFVQWPVDTDGMIRRFDEYLGIQEEKVVTLTGEAARKMGREPRAGYIDYALGGPGGYVAFSDVLDAAKREDLKWLQDRFQGKAVLLGPVLPYADPVKVPVALANWDVPLRDTPGVMLHAHALRSILSDRIIARVDPALVAALAFVAAVAGLAAGSKGVAAALAGALLVTLPAASVAALDRGFFLPFLWPLAAGLGSIALVQGLEVAARLAERRRLRSSFGGSVSPAVMQQILDGRINPQQGGVNLEVCVLFSDIRGYTTLSEGKSPEQIVAILNRYFDRMVDAIHATGGTVVSFMGDGIMAVFGAPQRLPNNCAAGFEAAVRMLDGVRDFNRELEAEGIAPIGIGVGLHVGPALAGHIGSKTRHDYTAIGDVTNVASRLEGATKEAGYRIVVSREVAEQLPDRTKLAHLGPVALKGHTPVDAFGYEKVEAASKPAPASALAHALAVAALGAILSWGSGEARAQRPSAAAALVSDLQGSVVVVRGNDRAPARLLADVLADSRLEVDNGGRIVLLMLSSGEEVELKGPSQGSVAADAVTATPAGSLSRRKGGVGGVQLRRKDLAQAAIVMRKTDQTVRPPLLSLAGTYTLEQPPVFRWTPVEASGPYRITLFDDAGQVLYETTTTQTEHRLPGSVTLVPQRRYTWEVATRRANGVEHANFGDFGIATPQTRSEVAARRPKRDAAFSERVAYAVWLDTLELADAAREVWKELAAERPGDEQLKRMAEQ